MASSNREAIPSFGSQELRDLSAVIGRGGMGVVKLHQWKINDEHQGIRKGRKVAVKHLDFSSDLDGVVDEAKILWALHRKCDFILPMFGLIYGSGVGIVLDYMKYGNVAEFFSVVCSHKDVDSPPNMSFIWQLKRRIAMQVCEGMSYLHTHSRPILHCDLKAANVLLDEELNAKICDFGLAKIKRLTTKPKSDESNSKELPPNCPAGTISHVAPELLRLGRHPTKQSDVYSFGILLWELLTGRLPYRETSNHFVIINEVLQKKRPGLELIPEGSPALLKDVMVEAWQQDPKKRPEFSELRRRFVDVENHPVGDAVEFAKRIWAIQRETAPKEILTRSTNYCGRREHQSYFQTEEYAQHPPMEQQLQQNNNVPRSDPNESEVEYSNDSNNGFISNNTVESESTKHLTEDHRAPLIVQARPPPQALPNAPKSSKWKVFAIVASLLLLFIAGGAVLGRYVIPSPSKGCCLNCFDHFEPGMQSECDPVSDDETAPPGSICKFSCEDGYVINGNITELKCGRNGVWSGPLPYCRKIRRCSQLAKPANGGDLKCTAEDFEGSKCSFSCRDGYQLRRPGGGVEPSPGAFDITCKSDDLSNYQWSGEEPYCEKVVNCPPPTSDQTVTLKCTPPSIDFKSVSGSHKDQTFSNGTTCNFSCPDTTSLVSNLSTATCLNTGKWNMTDTVSCINGCPYFGTPENGRYACTLGRMYNSKCNFSCENNYVMVGISVIVCQPSLNKGQWTKKPPMCECPACRSGPNCENKKDFKSTWEQINSSSAMTTQYDGREIICKEKEAVYRKKNPEKLAYGCQCRDRKTNTNKQCNDQSSLSEACRNAYASVLLLLTDAGKCDLPCDAEDMPDMC